MTRGMDNGTNVDAKEMLLAGRHALPSVGRVTSNVALNARHIPMATSNNKKVS